MEHTKKIFIFSFMGIIILSLIYLLFSPSEEVALDNDSYKDEVAAKQPKKKRNLSVLLGGGSGSNSSNSNSGKDGFESGDSLFESDFYKAGNATYDESEESENFVPQGDIPVDPNTGEPYTPEVMAEFDMIRKDLPNNDLIPKRLTPEEKEVRDRKNSELETAAQAVSGGEASRNQIIIHYEYVEKQALDRLELIEYIMENDDPDREVEGGVKIRDIFDNIKQQLEQVRKEKDEAFAQAGI